MSAISANRGVRSIRTNVRTDPKFLSVTYLVMQKARDLFPLKTSRHLSEITGYSVDAAESWLLGRRKLPSDALAALICSAFGFEILGVLMEGPGPHWYAEFSLMWDEAQLEAKRQELQRRREALREKP